MKTAVLVFLLSFAPFGCKAYVSHPGSINTADSRIYDGLFGAKTMIDTARAQLESGALRPSVKPALNEIIRVYNLTYPIYLAWHDAAQQGLPADQYLTDLNRHMLELSKAIEAFKGGK